MIEGNPLNLLFTQIEILFFEKDGKYFDDHTETQLNYFCIWLGLSPKREQEYFIIFQACILVHKPDMRSPDVIQFLYNFEPVYEHEHSKTLNFLDVLVDKIEQLSIVMLVMLKLS